MSTCRGIRAYGQMSLNWTASRFQSRTGSELADAGERVRSACLKSHVLSTVPPVVPPVIAAHEAIDVEGVYPCRKVVHSTSSCNELAFCGRWNTILAKVHYVAVALDIVNVEHVCQCGKVYSDHVFFIDPASVRKWFGYISSRRPVWLEPVASRVKKFLR